MTLSYDWFSWALLSAVFAALTAIFTKIGLEGVDSDLAYAYSYVCNHHHPCGVRVWRWQVEQPFRAQRENFAFSGFGRTGHRCFMGLLLSPVEGR
jgi:uncharacterized membrane protein